MFGFIASIIASWLEKLSLRWWAQHKEEEANEVKNKDAALSEHDAARRLSLWTKPD